EHVSMAGRCHEAQPEALDIVEGIVERMNFKLAAIAGTGIDFADRQRPAESPPGGASKRARQFGEMIAVERRRRLGHRRSDQAVEQELAHELRDRGPNTSN